jgi:hypothetical protein
MTLGLVAVMSERSRELLIRGVRSHPIECWNELVLGAIQVCQVVHEQLLERTDAAPSPRPQPYPGRGAGDGHQSFRPPGDVDAARVCPLQADTQQLQVVVDGDALRAYALR